MDVGARPKHRCREVKIEASFRHAAYRFVVLFFVVLRVPSRDEKLSQFLFEGTRLLSGAWVREGKFVAGSFDLRLWFLEKRIALKTSKQTLARAPVAAAVDELSHDG